MHSIDNWFLDLWAYLILFTLAGIQKAAMKGELYAGEHRADIQGHNPIQESNCSWSQKNYHDHQAPKSFSESHMLFDTIHTDCESVTLPVNEFLLQKTIGETKRILSAVSIVKYNVLQIEKKIKRKSWECIPWWEVSLVPHSYKFEFHLEKHDHTFCSPYLHVKS